MSNNGWTEEKTVRARRIWQEYQQQHDVSGRHGQAVGIDPDSGRVWFGESARAIREQLEAEKVDALLLFLRVGYDHYLHKRAQRRAQGERPDPQSGVGLFAESFTSRPS